jgi:chitin disaccharide deacetylase
MKVRINADDFGISPGVNSAVETMYQSRYLHSASLICGCGYLVEAIRIANSNPGLKVGLHFNLTTGFSAIRSRTESLLATKQRRFKNGFLSLLLLSIFRRKKLAQEVREELLAQLEMLKLAGLKINHIDSHRHVHMIPAIFKIVSDVASENSIKYVRVINEDLFKTWAMKHPKTYLIDGGLIKWVVLRFLALFNPKKDVYFFSILYTCSISADLIQKIVWPKEYKEAEIMIHPGNPEIDADLILEEKRHLVSKKRRFENALM